VKILTGGYAASVHRRFLRHEANTHAIQFSVGCLLAPSEKPASTCYCFAKRNIRSRSGEIPGPMVARERAPNHPFGLGAKSRWKKIKIKLPEDYVSGFLLPLDAGV